MSNNYTKHTLNILYSEAQILGNRESQEDALRALCVQQEAHHFDMLLVVADGLGGETAGEVASHLATKTFVEYYQKNLHTTPIEKLTHSLKQANLAIKTQIEEKRELKGMGCTLVALVIIENKAYWISVGDSILWLYRKNQLIRLNDEHSYGAILDELARRGEISKEMAKSSKDRHLLTSALTGEKIDQISFNQKPMLIEHNDYFMLASDGILSLNNKEIKIIFKEYSDPNIITKKIIERINLKSFPQQDNTTLQIIQCLSQDKNSPKNTSFWKIISIIVIILISIILLVLILNQ